MCLYCLHWNFVQVFDNYAVFLAITDRDVYMVKANYKHLTAITEICSKLIAKKLARHQCLHYIIVIVIVE